MKLDQFHSSTLMFFTLLNLKDFFGLIGYYRRFVNGYSKIAIPLTVLLQKNAFWWDDEATQAFKELKRVMISVPVLALPDFSLPFVIETDASRFNLGVVLSQDGKLIAYFNQKLGPFRSQIHLWEGSYIRSNRCAEMALLLIDKKIYSNF